MKKLLTLLLSLVLVMAMVTGCGAKNDSKEPEKTEKAVVEETKSPEETQEDTQEAGVKTGLAIISTADKSKDAGEEDGLAQVDSIIIAVIVDENGIITKCSIDAAQSKVNFSAEGKLITDITAELSTKQELGANYGMKKASGIGKEWNEQANALAEYVVGKTLKEVKGIALTEEGNASDEELSASVTVSISGYIDAIEKAVNSATVLGASKDDKLGLGVATNIANSTDSGEKEGLVQVYSYYTASTFNADGKITSSIIDASQSNVNFSSEGKITSDLTAGFQTKNEIGEGYGMKKKSGIGKEWNEQAAAFAGYVVGKTVEEVKGISLKEGVPTEEDLTSSVTVHVTDFITIIEKANTYAK
jgi:hypothetical protein